MDFEDNRKITEYLQTDPLSWVYVWECVLA